MKKVHVWQLGYAAFKDFALHNNNVECRQMGYVEVADEGSSQDLRDRVWELLNWSCWAEKKPDEVETVPNEGLAMKNVEFTSEIVDTITEDTKKEEEE